MTIIQLQYILAVEKYRNFTLAAEKCFVTQPTLSMQIQKFEKEFSIEIFDRNTHPIKPTKIGELLISHMEAVLQAENKIKLLIHEEKGNITGNFRIGVIPTILSSLVPLFLKTFNKKYPESKLIIKELKTHEIISQLKNNSLDFGIVVTPLQDSQIIEHTLYYEPMVAYVPLNHAFSQRKSINESELDGNDILLLEDGNCFRNNVLNLCGKNQRENPISVDSGNFNTLLKLADEGFGMTILPTLFTEELSETRKKNIIEFTNPIPTREVSLIHHQTQLRETFKNEFIKIIKGILRGTLLFKSENVSLPTLTVPN
jgi:LysR family transcriptional regulator, hydrogen peroxide-inducible genes activator